MIQHLKHYPAYKDSGVPWLGEVPEHWEVLPGRTVFREINNRGHPDEQMLSVTITRGVLRQADLLADSSKKDSSNEDKSNYKLVQPGDLVYNKMRAWQGAVGVSAYRGIVSPAYIVQRLRSAENLPRYMHFLLRTPLFAMEAERWSYGITSDQWSLRAEEFKCIYFSLPPLPEQTAIVRFLDYIDRRIRRSIRAKQKPIKLLEEYRQALIHQAVTGKIDVRTGKPYPAYKDSGVPWLGQVPQHWEVRRIKTLFRETDERNGDGSGPLLSLTRARGIVPQAEASNRIASVEDLSNYKVCKSGDLIMNRMQAWSGMFAVSGIDGVISPDYSVFKPKAPIDVHYFEALFKTPLLVEEFAKRSKGIGSGFNRLYTPDFGAVPIASPPLSEQTAIVEYLDAQTAKLDTAIATTRREIELLREYRTRLIADVVTGKVDVRQVAVQLPYEPPEEEAGTEEEEVAAEELATVDSQEEANGEE